MSIIMARLAFPAASVAVLIFHPHLLVFCFRVFPFLVPVSSVRLNCPELQ